MCLTEYPLSITECPQCVSLSIQYLAVVSVFQNLVILITNFVAYLIPDMPRKLREQVRREAYLTNEIILKTELEKAQGQDGVLTPQQLEEIRKRAETGVHEGGVRQRNGQGADNNTSNTCRRMDLAGGCYTSYPVD